MRFALSVIVLAFLSFVAASPYSVPESGVGHKTAIGGSQLPPSGTPKAPTAPSSVPSGGPVHGRSQSYGSSGAPVPSGQPGGHGGNGKGDGTSAYPSGAQPSSGTKGEHGGRGSDSAGLPAQTAGDHSHAGGAPTPTATVTTTPAPTQP